MCSDADKWVNIEAAMREKGVGWILCELAGSKETEIRWTAKYGIQPRRASYVEQKVLTS